jgi:hypothetical protein
MKLNLYYFATFQEDLDLDNSHSISFNESYEGEIAALKIGPSHILIKSKTSLSHDLKISPETSAVHPSPR